MSQTTLMNTTKRQEEMQKQLAEAREVYERAVQARDAAQRRLTHIERRISRLHFCIRARENARAMWGGCILFVLLILSVYIIITRIF